MIIAPYFMARDPKIFADPLKFDPNRFTIERSNPFSYVPFSAGPRNCKFSHLSVSENKY